MRFAGVGRVRRRHEHPCGLALTHAMWVTMIRFFCGRKGSAAVRSVVWCQIIRIILNTVREPSREKQASSGAALIRGATSGRPPKRSRTKADGQDRRGGPGSHVYCVRTAQQGRRWAAASEDARREAVRAGRGRLQRPSARHRRSRDVVHRPHRNSWASVNGGGEQYSALRNWYLGRTMEALRRKTADTGLHAFGTSRTTISRPRKPGSGRDAVWRSGIVANVCERRLVPARGLTARGEAESRGTTPSLRPSLRRERMLWERCDEAAVQDEAWRRVKGGIAPRVKPCRDSDWWGRCGARGREAPLIGWSSERPAS